MKGLLMLNYKIARLESRIASLESQLNKKAGVWLDHDLYYGFYIPLRKKLMVGGIDIEQTGTPIQSNILDVVVVSDKLKIAQHFLSFQLDMDRGLVSIMGGRTKKDLEFARRRPSKIVRIQDIPAAAKYVVEHLMFSRIP